ncbi:MAG: molybdopterin/thiamine biosynthesis adenylyltransferase, partial [Planctomycetota bacterium]
MDKSEEKYSRQILFTPIGSKGHSRIRLARVGLVGLGALGSSIAETLVRAGIGTLVAIDRDVIEPSNLHRQGLYQEDDAQNHLPKATAAKKRLEAMNSDVVVETHVADFRSENAEELFTGCDVLVDGTDSFETRYLINDLAVSMNIPWVYGACVGATGMTATIIPGTTPCLTCLFPDPPPPGSGETCDTAGIIAPASQIVASLQVTECLKILTESWDDLRPGLLSFELWPFRLIQIGT